MAIWIFLSQTHTESQTETEAIRMHSYFRESSPKVKVLSEKFQFL